MPTMPPRFDIYDRPKKPSTLDGGWTARRKCECCKVTRSATQFAGAETTCNQCKRRTPAAIKQLQEQA